MADANIGSLPKATQVDDESLLVMEQQGQAMSLTGKQIKDYAKNGLALNFKEDVDAAKAAADRAVSAVSAVTEMTVGAHASDMPAVQKSMREGKVHLQFGLPKGDIGPVGPEGPEGPRGKQGIPGTGKAVLGHYDTLEELRSAVQNPEVGDPYGVGTELPYDIWIFDGPTQDWINYGPLSLGGGGPIPEDVVTTDGGAEMLFWSGPGPHRIEFDDEEPPPLTVSDVVYDTGTVADAISQLFTSGSEAKGLISSAVTAKGVPTSADDTWAEMADNISKIESGGGGTGDATATPGDILAGKTAYVATGKVEGVIPILGPTVYTPGVEAQQIANGQYLGGTQIIQGDTNLVSANIRKGASIFGVDGEMTSTFQATLTVTVDIGAVVTATHSSGVSIEALSTTGKVTLELPIEGQWTVTAQRGVAQYNSVVITVSSQYSAALTAEIHIEYYISGTPLSVGKAYSAATMVGNYAIFAGGECSYYSGSATDSVDAYDSSLTHTTAEHLSIAASRPLGASIGKYAIIYTHNVGATNAYDESLSRTTIDAIRHYEGATVSVGGYALFAGGNNGSEVTTEVSVFDSSLTLRPSVRLIQARLGVTGVGVGNHAILAGGSANGTVDAFDSNLTRTNPPSLSIPRNYPAAAAAGSYAVFAGGMDKSNSPSDAVEAYDLFLTRTIVHDGLATARSQLAATTLSGFAIFAGGDKDLGAETDVVDVYDPYLTHTTTEKLSRGRYGSSAAAIGNYALIAGGNYGNSSFSYLSVVDIYRYV